MVYEMQLKGPPLDKAVLKKYYELVDVMADLDVRDPYNATKKKRFIGNFCFLFVD